MTTDHLPIGRPRSFDEDETLDRVIALFWRLGFDATSYSDLEAATGLHRQSLRYAFGDKEQLFQRAVDRYGRRKLAEILSALECGATPLSGLTEAFRIWARDAGANGCLVVNTLAERGPSASPALGSARHVTSQLRERFESAFRRAQALGEIRSDLPSDVLAAQVVALGDGLMVHGRGQALSASSEDVFRAYLTLLKP